MSTDATISLLGRRFLILRILGLGVILGSLVLHPRLCTAAEPGTILWEFQTGFHDFVMSDSPLLGDDGTIYVAGVEGNVGKILAISPEGRKLWTRNLGNYDYPLSALIGSDASIYVRTTLVEDSLFALTTAGSVLWQVPLRSCAGAWASSLALQDDEGLIVGSSDCLTSELYTVSTKGTAQSLIASSQWFFYGPSIRRDGTIVVSRDRALGGGANVVSLNRLGAVDWAIPVNGSNFAVGTNGTIYFPSGYAAGESSFYAVTANGSVEWIKEGAGKLGFSPAAIDATGNIFVGCNDGTFYALNQDGSEMWKRNTGEAFHSCPALASDGTVYFSGIGGVSALNASDGVPKWKTPILSPHGLNPPAVGLQGTVYVSGRNGSLYALKGAAPLARSPWPKSRGNARNTSNVRDSPYFLEQTGKSTALVSNIRARQRPNTSLVDLQFDLNGAGSGSSVSVAVSSDGGASFTVPATHFSGDGVTSPATPGSNRLIVWEAGADFPGQFSTQMRIKIAAGSAFAISPIFVVDTRSVLSGSVSGKVLGSGVALANAQLRVLDTPYSAITGTGGAFNINNIPSGSGYVVTVAAPGFASVSLPNVQVTANPRDLGVIELRPLGPRAVIPLVPDLNPLVSRVEEGGVAYRYYSVVSVDGKTPAGGVTLQARWAGGTAIPQTGDVADSWPGREAGVSDADGIVRLRVPSSGIGNAGTTRKVEVLDGEKVVQSFDVLVLPFRHEKVWGHRLDGSVAGKLGGIRLEPGGQLETEVRDSFTGPITRDQTIERRRTLAGKAGVEASVGSLKVGSVRAGARAGFGGYMNLQWLGKWRFNPDELDSVLNMQKVYFAFGDIIFLGPLGAEFYGKLSDFWYGAGLQDVLMVGSGGVVHLGGYSEGEAGFGIGNIGSFNVRAGAEFEGSMGGFLGHERNYSLGNIQEHTLLFGFEAEAHRSIGATAALTKFNGNRLRGLGGGLHLGESASVAARVHMDWQSQRVKASSLTLEIKINRGGDMELLGWKGVDSALGNDEYVTLSETYTLTFSEANGFDKVAALGKLWDAVRPGSGSAPILTQAGVNDTTTALAIAAEELGGWTTYERSIHRGYEGEFAFPVGVNTLAAALELDFTANADRGAAMVIERGVAPGGRLFPQEYQPDRSRALIPTEKIFDKELAWLTRAEFPATSGFSRFAEYVSTANPNVTIGDRFSMFFQDVAGGAQIVGSSVLRRFGGGGSPAPQQRRLSQSSLMAGAQASLPTPDQTNYVYGVSGLLQLTLGTTAFPGTARLVMRYSEDQVTGLKEGDLRIYHLADTTNQWKLVGGVVDTVSNLVTMEIDNFGTYSIAPPMPQGDVNLQASNLNLNANGTDELLLVATNLQLNTGGTANDAWLFTVEASGIDLLDADVSPDWPGVQVVSSNAAFQVRLRAPLGGTYANVSVRSVVGNAFGQIGINLLDSLPPTVPANVAVAVGQSRVGLSWTPNSEPDMAGYRVYYRAGIAGPPWDGAAAVEGTESPVRVTGTNFLLRGLLMGTNYFVSVAAVDTTGNESALSPAIKVTTFQQPPNPPASVAVRFGGDSTNVLMWARSEDDGYNDRDVIRYEVWRAVMPEADWIKVGEVDAGIGLFSEPNPAVQPTQHLRYAVAAVDALGATSALSLANRIITGTPEVDNDGDGMADNWELAHTLDLANSADAHDDPDRDGLTNLREYQLGLNPLVPNLLYLEPLLSEPTGAFALNIQGHFGRSVTLEISTNLLTWQTLTNITGSDAPLYFEGREATNDDARFYRAVVP